MTRWSPLVLLGAAVCALTGGCAPGGADDVLAQASSGTFAVAPSPAAEFSPEGVATAWIEAGGQLFQVPEGIRLPPDVLIASATEATVMIAEADPQRVIDVVSESAKEAGYVLVAEPHEGCRLWVGHGNAVLLDATAGAQILSWGPESMRDVLATG
ncbi:MAG TPA: hypothetical protein PKE40_12770 [Arachnia sp.]|nr:hypothetical protein [Arachnia sp.]HMT87216.1 hypothetical protein [Arachnia sp.]